MRPVTDEVKGFSGLRPFLLFVLLAFLAYSTIINSYFLSDDFVQIGKVLEGDWSLSWGREHGGFFRPLFILSYITDSLVWGREPAGYHVTNIALHALNSYLLYSLALPLLRRQSLKEDETRLIALAAAMLFLLHPSHTEAVSWISGRADLLATLFCLASLKAYTSYLEKRGPLLLLLSLLCFALALVSKEAAVSLPIITLATGLYLAPTGQRRAALMKELKACALFCAVLLLFICVRRLALGTWLGGYGAEQHLNFSPGWLRDRFLQASVRALLPAFPTELARILLKPLKSPVFILAAVSALCLIVYLIRRRRRTEDRAIRRGQNGLLLLIVLGFVASLLPVLNLRISPLNTQGERFIYWPSVFTSLLLSYLSFILMRRRWWQALMLCLLVFYAVSLYRTNQTWREAGTLSRSITDELALSTSPQRSLIVINAPDNLRGAPLFHNGLEEALRVFQKERPAARTLVVSLHDIQSGNDRVELKREAGAFTLNLPRGDNSFTRIADGQGECLEGLERSDNTVRFRLRGCMESPGLFLFSQGKMYRVLVDEGTGVGRR